MKKLIILILWIFTLGIFGCDWDMADPAGWDDAGGDMWWDAGGDVEVDM